MKADGERKWLRTGCEGAKPGNQFQEYVDRARCPQRRIKTHPRDAHWALTATRLCRSEE